MSNPQNYTVGCICAFTTEAVALRAFLDETHDGPDAVAQHDNNSYALGKIGRHNVVIAVLPSGEYGLVNAAAVARDMLHSFPNVRVGLMVGIGGGSPTSQHDIRLGDVVVSTPGNGNTGVLQYDFGKAIQDQEFLETGTLDKPPPLVLTAISQLKSTYELDGHRIEENITEVLQKKARLQKKYSRPPAACDKLYKSDFKHRASDADCSIVCGDDHVTLVSRDKREDKGEDNLKVHYGLVASANTLMKDAIVRDKLATERGILCFEMEAAGLMNHFPCLVIRGICDYADTHKNKEWQGYAAMAAAAYARDLLREIPPNKVESETRISEVLGHELETLQKLSHEVKTNVLALRSDYHITSIKKWLSPADPSDNVNKARKKRHPGTGAWFLKSDYFTEWEHGSRQHLWLYGMPGCGKTVLSSTISDHLAQKEGCVMLQFFFDFTNSQKQKVDGMLRSMVFQLYNSSSVSQKYLNNLFESCGDGANQSDTEQLSRVLKDMLGACKNSFILLDALDECSDRSQLLKWLEAFIPGISQAQVILTGRPEDGFKRSLHSCVGEANCVSLNEEVVNDDIRSYVKCRLDGPDFERWATLPDVLKEVSEAVISKANGMFRWAACQLDCLADCIAREELEDALQFLPPDLDATYARILQNIPERRKKKSIRLLQFLTYSERPMLLSEAIDVIAIRHDVENFDRGYFDPNDRLTRHEDVAGYCSSLVSFVQDERGRLNLQLAHFSVKEYLMGSFIGYSPSPSVTITETCLTYLSSVQRDPTINHILKVELLYPFAVSAAIIWTTHAKYAEESGPTLDRIANFILDTSKLAVWQSLERLGRGRGVWFRSPETLQSRSGSGSRWYDHNPLAPAFHIACREGLVATAKRLISDGADIDAGRYVRDTPLVTASETGQEDIVRFLLDRSANGTSEALQAASGRGYEGIVKLLLDRGVDITSEALNAASYSASYSGREAIVRLFLDRSADINSSQAVEAASYSGHEAIVLLLLDRGANATSKALEAASYSGHEAIVLLLLDRGANATSKALEAASYSGHEAIVLLLLDRGANATNKALQHASGVYHKTTVQRLLDQGAKVTSEALCAAVKSGHEAVVQLLLERGTDVDISKALQVASTTEHEAVVQLLLNHGANATSEALRIALYAGHEAVVQLLLDRGANIDISRALLTASFSGHTAIVQLLLDRGASVTRKALCAASQSGHEGIVQLLQNFRGRQHQSNPRQLRPRT